MAMIHKVAVTEGQAVKQGEELFVLRSDEVRNLDMQFRTLSEDLREREASLAKADDAYKAQTEIKDAEIAQSETEVGFRERHVKTSRELVERMEKLSKSGGISQIELLRLRLDLAGSEKDLSIAQRTLQQVNLERQRMEMDRSRQRGQDVSEIEKLKYRLAGLKRDLENAEQNLLTLRAPYDAVVISLAQRTPGSVVQNGQELCHLARLEAKPRARLLLTESGLPKLSVGQRVRFFFDAFPYQRYGTINANLDWISPSVVSSPEGPRFVALASIDEADAAKRPKPLPVRVGMRGQARIKVGSRTMMEYAFEPIKQLRENMRN
jgi:multidrug resistance efflux pump